MKEAENEVGYKLKMFFQKCFSMHNVEKNFGSKCEAKQMAYEQSIAHYTSKAKLWALRGCESTNKAVGRGNSTHFAQGEKNKFQEEKYHFIFSVSYGKIP